MKYTDEEVIKAVVKEVAREIFEEIEELAYRYLNDVDYSGGDIIYDLAELKKKYTEGEK